MAITLCLNNLRPTLYEWSIYELRKPPGVLPLSFAERVSRCAFGTSTPPPARASFLSSLGLSPGTRKCRTGSSSVSPAAATSGRGNAISGFEERAIGSAQQRCGAPSVYA